MKKLIHYIIINIIICSCGMTTIDVYAENMIKQKDMNSMISIMPVYEEDNVIYYADSYKTLKCKRVGYSDVILDECLYNELITDIYMLMKNIYII